MPESSVPQEARDAFITRIGWGFTGVAILAGAAIIACHIESGPRRWMAASWQFALQVPGSPATWGVVLLIAGLVMLTGRLRANRKLFHYGCFAAFWWFVLVCGASFASLLADPNVNPLSSISWGAFAFVYGSLFTETNAPQNE